MSRDRPSLDTKPSPTERERVPTLSPTTAKPSREPTPSPVGMVRFDLPVETCCCRDWMTYRLASKNGNNPSSSLSSFYYPNTIETADSKADECSVQETDILAPTLRRPPQRILVWSGLVRRRKQLSHEMSLGRRCRLSRRFALYERSVDLQNRKGFGTVWVG
jgi:hypothetical protein